MEKRYDDLLTTRLENVFDQGCAHVLWSELYRWYGVQRIAARLNRDLESRWQDISEGKAGQLYRVKGGDGLFLFRGDRIKQISKDNDEE